MKKILCLFILILCISLAGCSAAEAPEVSAEAEEKQETLEKKPVSTAIDEVYSGKLSIK